MTTLTTCPLCKGACPKFALICDDCEMVSRSGLEESSFTNMALSSIPSDMSDPWDMVGA